MMLSSSLSVSTDIAEVDMRCPRTAAALRLNLSLRALNYLTVGGNVSTGRSEVLSGAIWRDLTGRLGERRRGHWIAALRSAVGV